MTPQQIFGYKSVSKELSARPKSKLNQDMLSAFLYEEVQWATDKQAKANLGRAEEKKGRQAEPEIGERVRIRPKTTTRKLQAQAHSQGKAWWYGFFCC
jgi:hypothetical protein